MRIPAKAGTTSAIVSQALSTGYSVLGTAYSVIIRQFSTCRAVLQRSATADLCTASRFLRHWCRSRRSPEVVDSHQLARGGPLRSFLSTWVRLAHESRGAWGVSRVIRGFSPFGCLRAVFLGICSGFGQMQDKSAFGGLRFSAAKLTFVTFWHEMARFSVFSNAAPHAPRDLCANLTQVNRNERSGLVCAS